MVRLDYPLSFLVVSFFFPCWAPCPPIISFLHFFFRCVLAAGRGAGYPPLAIFPPKCGLPFSISPPLVFFFSCLARLFFEALLLCCPLFFRGDFFSPLFPPFLFHAGCWTNFQPPLAGCFDQTCRTFFDPSRRGVFGGIYSMHSFPVFPPL